MRPTIGSLRNNWMVRAIPATLALVLTLALLGSCGSVSRNPRKDLLESLNDYHADLMWERYPEASGYLPAEQRGGFLSSFDDVDDDIYFTEFEIGTIEMDEETDQASVRITLTWYRIPYYVIEETEIRETWTISDEDDYWWLTARTDPEEPVNPERYRFAYDLAAEAAASTEGTDDE